MKSKNYKNSQKRQDIIFMTVMLAWPVIIFLAYYVYCNSNMFILAFQSYDVSSEKYYFSGFNNFASFIEDIFYDTEMLGYVKNSFITYGVSLLTMPISIMLSNYIYKSLPGSKLFKIIVFLPSIVSSMVWVLMFRYFIERAVPTIFDLSFIETKETLITYGKTTFWVMLGYNVWLGFAANMVLYTGAMARIPQEVVEYGKLDGLRGIKELWYVTIPLIFPTIQVFLVTGVAGIFTNQLGMYGFFGNGAPIEARTLGYHFFAILFERGATPSYSSYNYSSAAGILFTLIVAPITILVKNLLTKYGPSAEY